MRECSGQMAAPAIELSITAKVLHDSFGSGARPVSLFRAELAGDVPKHPGDEDDNRDQRKEQQPSWVEQVKHRALQATP